MFLPELWISTAIYDEDLPFHDPTSTNKQLSVKKSKEKAMKILKESNNNAINSGVNSNQNNILMKTKKTKKKKNKKAFVNS